MELRRFQPTDFSDLPYHPQGGQGATLHRGWLEYPAGNAVYEFQAGADETVVNLIGPDLDHGLPSSRRGVIVQLAKSHQWLLAALDASLGTGVSNVGTRSSAGFGSSRRSTFGSQTGYSLVLGRDRRGWQVLWQSGASSRPINAILVSNAYSQYRLWIAADQRVSWLKMPVEVINPLQVTTTAYGASAVLETPWIDHGLANQVKLALSTIVETTNPTSSETVLVEYATDFVETYTTLGTISATGQQKYFYGTSRRGLTYRAIKYRVTLTRGSTNTNTPTLRKLTHVYRPRTDILYGVDATIDLNDTTYGPAVQQLTNLRASLNLPTDVLLEVTWRDDTTDAQNYQMDPIDLRAVESSGREVSGQVIVRLVEPSQSASR